MRTSRWAAMMLAVGLLAVVGSPVTLARPASGATYIAAPVMWPKPDNPTRTPVVVERVEVPVPVDDPAAEGIRMLLVAAAAAAAAAAATKARLRRHYLRPAGNAVIEIAGPEPLDSPRRSDTPTAGLD
jgi:hypothetical protein